jgi:cytochrome P450
MKHPDQRRQIAEDKWLVPQAIEELLRYEPPAPHVARYVTRDVEYYGRTVPEGSVLMMLIGAANRDHRQFPPEGDVFDIHREARQHLTFSVGTHYCLGSALARLEGAHRARGNPQAVPRVGDRLRQRATVSDVNGPGLGRDAGIHQLKPLRRLRN